jgi:MSHA biogenesis protein MshO
MSQRQRGFTLIEMMIVIVISGIIAAAVAVFMRAPVQSYFDTTRRAEVTDRTDTVLRRIGRDLRLALPNSVRVATVGANTAIEFLVTRSGGRYRASLTSAGTGDMLDFSSGADNSFDVLGPAVQVALGDQIVIYNLGIPGADAYAGDTRRAYPGAGGALANIPYTATGTPFPFSSPDNRFHVIAGSPVAYNCNLATGQLTRHAGYAIAAAQSVPPPVAGDLIAENVTACAFTYDPLAIAQRAGLVTMTLTMTRSGEAVTLYQTVHVNNVP